MSQDEITAIGHRFVAIFNEQKSAIADEIFAPNFVAYVSGAPTPTLDREGWKAYLESLRAGFPDLHLEVKDMIASEDKLVLRVVLHGTHTNTFQGLAPTGKQIAFDGVAMHRIENGQVVEHWGVMDLLSMMQQLGAIPSRKGLNLYQGVSAPYGGVQGRPPHVRYQKTDEPRRWPYQVNFCAA